MKYKLTIHPIMDTSVETYTTNFFETKKELEAAKNSCADLLLFLQDKLHVMPDESNIFICEEKVGNEWEEMDT